MGSGSVQARKKVDALKDNMHMALDQMTYSGNSAPLAKGIERGQIKIFFTLQSHALF